MSTFPFHPGKIFVFGSNLAGIHGAGAAREARERYGAIFGKGLGLQGSSYAIPTKDREFKSLPLVQINYFVAAFLQWADVSSRDEILHHPHRHWPRRLLPCADRSNVSPHARELRAPRGMEGASAMTELRKICPNSGKSCDCPKGRCEAPPYSLEAIKDVLEYAAMSAYSQEVDAERKANENEAAQADSLEAHSIKYQACAQITLLSSGKFALFGAYRAGGGSGIELLAIGTWEELEPHVREYRRLADAAHARGQERTLPAKTAADYDSLFGES